MHVRKFTQENNDMRQSEQVYNLKNRTFSVSKNLGAFPVHTIIFSAYESERMIYGTLRGEGINSGQFNGRFVAVDQLEIFFQWIDSVSLLEVSGRLWGFICGNPSEKLLLYLNWHYTYGNIGVGLLSCTELKNHTG